MKALIPIILLSFWSTIIYGQNYVNKITINNPLTTTLSNYQVLLKINTAQLISAGMMRSDCGDIRFVTDTTATGQSIDYWIERGCNTDSTHVWVKIPVLPIGNTDIFMTAGQPTLTSAANGDAVFIFFDDFQTGTIDPAKWNLLANANTNLGLARFEAPAMQTNTSATNDNNLRTNVNLPTSNYALHTNFYDNGIASSIQNTWVGIVQSPLGNSLYNGIRFGTDATYYDYRQGNYNNTSIPRVTNSWHNTIIYQTATQARITQDSTYDTGFFPNLPNPTYLSLYSHNNSTFFDNVFIRQYLGTDLTVRVVNALEICDNGIDDDGDGLIDCYDDDCCSAISCTGHYFTACDTTYSCAVDSFADNFSIQQLWQENEGVNGLTVPVVGDLDKDGFPEIVATKYNQTLVIFDGHTGAVKQTISTLPGATTTYNSGIVLADVDNDGMAEILYPAGDNRIHCFESDGTLVWSSNQSVTTKWATIASVADFNQDGLPEVYAGKHLLNGQTGVQMGLCSSSYGTTGGQLAIGDFANPVAVDVLPDGACAACAGLELVAGNTVYTVDINTTTNVATIVAEVVLATEPDGLTSIADWDGDGDIDGVITHTIGNQARLYVWDLQTATLIGTTGNISRGGSFGTIGVSTATVADVDEDGLVEASFILNQKLQVVENNFTIKWSLLNSDRSGSTGTALYDFDGNGQYELVYRDETMLRIFDANSGTLKNSIPCASGTGTERPIIADINADGQTEILCTCSNFVTAFTSNRSPWMPARKLWNQYQYFATNINDDLSVPRYQQQHHVVGDSMVLNSFFKQFQNDDNTPIADATVTILTTAATISPDSIDITVQICNVGDNTLPANTPITFYKGNPTSNVSAVPIASIMTIGQNIEAGNCITQTYRVLGMSHSVYVVVNCDNSFAPVFDFSTNFPMTSIGECNYLNNMDNQTILLNNKLLDFRVKKHQQTKSSLSWELERPREYTESVIERSKDGLSFKPIAAKIAPNAKQYIDLQPTTGDNYYRIRFIKINGQYHYTAIKYLSFANDNGHLQVYPNPSQQSLTVKSNEDNRIQQIELVNVLGEVLRVQTVNNKSVVEVDLSGFSAGAYWLKVQSGGHWSLKKVIKQ